MSEIAVPEMAIVEQQMQVAEQQAMWDRIKDISGRVLGRAALVGALITGATAGIAATEERPAMAAGCYGDYCSGQYADEMGCDWDATPIAEATIKRSGLGVSVTAGPVGVSGQGDDSEIGKLEVRYSPSCGTTWGRLDTKAGKSAWMSGINAVGIKQDGGYTQKRDIGGRWNGSPAALSFTPMIYGRDRMYHAFVESRDYNIPNNDGTYWVEPS